MDEDDHAEDALEQGGEIERQNVGVTVPMLHPVALMYRVQSPADSVVLTIAEYHATDPDVQVRPVWSGRITSVRWDPEENQATITHAPTYASLQRNGLRRKYQANCPLVLYGLACGVNREAYKLAEAFILAKDTYIRELPASQIDAGY